MAINGISGPFIPPQTPAQGSPSKANFGTKLGETRAEGSETLRRLSSMENQLSARMAAGTELSETQISNLNAKIESVTANSSESMSNRFDEMVARVDDLIEQAEANGNSERVEALEGFKERIDELSAEFSDALAAAGDSLVDMVAVDDEVDDGLEATPDESDESGADVSEDEVLASVDLSA